MTTYTLDLESRWQAETRRRQLTLDDGAAAAFDVEVEVAASPAETWAHLTAPALRTTWEGPLEIRDYRGEGWRGVGTTSLCVTGRLATLEEIVDWQPYEHIGYRLAVPGVGPVESTYDLRSEGDRTAVRLRWGPVGNATPEADAVDVVRRDKEAALGRLARLLGAREEEEVPA